MITIDIDAKIEAIKVGALSTGGFSSVFVLRDANNPETTLHISFYKKQMDFIVKSIYQADRERMIEDLKLEFIKREVIKMQTLKDKILELEMMVAILTETEEEE